MRDAMIDGFAEALDVELVEGDLTQEELGLAGVLKPKYASVEWLKSR
jgi:lipoate-protein ligase A